MDRQTCRHGTVMNCILLQAASNLAWSATLQYGTLAAKAVQQVLAGMISRDAHVLCRPGQTSCCTIELLSRLT